MFVLLIRTKELVYCAGDPRVTRGRDDRHRPHGPDKTELLQQCSRLTLD